MYRPGKGGRAATDEAEELLASYRSDGHAADLERLEKWARAHPGEAACLVLAKARLLEAFHAAHGFLSDDSAVPEHAFERTEQEVRQEAANENRVLSILKAAFDQAWDLAKHHRSLAGAVLAANILYVERARPRVGQIVQILERQARAGRLTELLQEARRAGDGFWREPLSSPEVWEPFPWETDARRGASARLLQELDQRAQRSRADDARLLSQEPMNATNYTSPHDLAHSITAPIVARLAALDDMLLPKLVAKRLLMHWMQRCKDLSERSKAAGQMRSAGVPRHVLHQQAQRSVDKQYVDLEKKLRMAEKLEDRRAKRAEAQQPQRAQQAHGTPAAPAADRAAVLDLVRRKLQERLPAGEGKEAKQGGCQQAVRAVAALGAKQLAQEAAQLEKGGAWSGGQAAKVVQLVEGVREGRGPCFRWPRVLAGRAPNSRAAVVAAGLPMLAPPGKKGLAAAAGGAASALPAGAAVASADRFQELLQQHFELGGGAEAAREELLHTLPALDRVMGAAAQAWREHTARKSQAGDEDPTSHSTSSSPKSAPSWPPPPLVKTPLPDPRRLAAVEDVHPLDLKLLADLRQSGPGPEGVKKGPMRASWRRLSGGIHEVDEYGSKLDWQQFIFYDRTESKLEALVPTRLPVSFDWDVMHPEAHKWGEWSHNRGLMRGMLARAVAGRHMLRLLHALEQGQAPSLDEALAVQRAVYTPHLGPEEALRALEVPALHDVGCSMAASLVADVGPSQAADSSGPLLVQSGARLMLVLLAAEHGAAQHAQRSWDTEWVLQAKQELLHLVHMGLRQLQARSRLSVLLLKQLGWFLQQGLAATTGIKILHVPDEEEEKVLHFLFDMMCTLPLVALAQIYCAVCLWTAQRFLDLPDLDPRFQDLLGSAALAVEVFKGSGEIQLTQPSLARLVAPAAGSQATSALDDCAARLVQYCLPPAAPGSAEMHQGPAAGGPAAAGLLPLDPCWGPLGQDGAAGAAREAAGPAGSAWGALALPGAGEGARDLVSNLMQLLYLRGMVGCLEEVLLHVRHRLEEVKERAVLLFEELTQEHPEVLHFDPVALTSLRGEAEQQILAAYKLGFMSKYLLTSMSARMHEWPQPAVAEELRRLERQLERDRNPKLRAELRERRDMLAAALKALEVNRSNTVQTSQEARKQFEQLAGPLAHLSDLLAVVRKAGLELRMWCKDHQKCSTVLELRVVFEQRRKGLANTLGMLVAELQTAEDNVQAALLLHLAPLHEWAWCKAQLLAAALQRQCWEDPPAVLARVLLREVLPRAWRRELEQSHASSSDAVLEELLREEEQQKAREAAEREKAERRRAKKQAQKAAAQAAAEAAQREEEERKAAAEATEREAAERVAAERAAAEAAERAQQAAADAAHWAALEAEQRAARQRQRAERQQAAAMVAVARRGKDGRLELVPPGGAAPAAAGHAAGALGAAEDEGMPGLAEEEPSLEEVPLVEEQSLGEVPSLVHSDQGLCLASDSDSECAYSMHSARSTEPGSPVSDGGTAWEAAGEGGAGTAERDGAQRGGRSLQLSMPQHSQQPLDTEQQRPAVPLMHQASQSASAPGLAMPPPMPPGMAHPPPAASTSVQRLQGQPSGRPSAGGQAGAMPSAAAGPLGGGARPLSRAGSDAAQATPSSIQQQQEQQQRKTAGAPSPGAAASGAARQPEAAPAAAGGKAPRRRKAKQQAQQLVPGSAEWAAHQASLDAQQAGQARRAQQQGPAAASRDREEVWEEVPEEWRREWSQAGAPGEQAAHGSTLLEPAPLLPTPQAGSLAPQAAPAVLLPTLPGAAPPPQQQLGWDSKPQQPGWEGRQPEGWPTAAAADTALPASEALGVLPFLDSGPPPFPPAGPGLQPPTPGLRGFEPHAAVSTPAADAAAPATHSLLTGGGMHPLPPGPEPGGEGGLWALPAHPASSPTFPSQPGALPHEVHRADSSGAAAEVPAATRSHLFPQPGASGSLFGPAAGADAPQQLPAVPQPETATAGSFLGGWAAPEPAAPGEGGAEGEDDLSAMLAAMGVGTSQDEELPGPSQQPPQQAQQGWVPPGLLGAAAPVEALEHLPSWGQQQVAPLPPQPAHPSGPSYAREQQQQQHGVSYAVALAGAQPGHAQPPERTALDSAAEQTSGMGLTNEAGEYNCFLNVVIQCLWYCRPFREKVEAWPPAFYAADPVVHALRDLFVELAVQERQCQAAAVAGGGGAGGQRQQPARGVVNPNRLREALAAVPGTKFQEGEMSDAGELLQELFTHVTSLQEAQGCVAEVTEVFGLSVTEAVNCHKCGATTHQSCYSQWFYNTQATALRLQQLANGGEACSLGHLLKQIEEQAVKSCDTDEGGCGEWNSVNHFLDRAPRVLALQMAWESQQEEAASIAATLGGVQEEVDLGHIYHALGPGRHVYRLRSLVCYYGAHYHAFVLMPDLGRWLMFDDTRVSNVGDWVAVRLKCQAGRLQPSVLFYTSAKEAA